MHDLNHKLNTHYPGKVVRKDLTKRIKEGANVPVYVLEYLLGMYCATEDETTIEEGLERVKKILAQNYVRPDEAELVKSKIRELGRFTVIDQVSVTLNEKNDIYQGTLTNLGIKNLVIDPEIVKTNSKLLGSGIWCILQLEYEAGAKPSPFIVASLKPVQMPTIDMEELFNTRSAFTRSEWIDILIRSTGIEPTTLKEEVKWHLLARLIPLCENNYNSCELGPRSTGKSHVYKEVSPNSILISGGKTTVANLFYNMSTRRIGLVGLFDVVAFDEVAGISFHDNDGVQIMKDYMASGSFARGKAEISANASMVFVGNIDHSVESLVKTSHLLAPFPQAMIDTAFFDRFHAYIPGWEVPKFSPENFTNQYGFIVDYLAEWLREMRKRSFADVLDKYFRLGNNLKQRDVQAVRKTVSGMLKLLFPDGSFSKEDVRDALVYALRVRRRVKEQLKKIGGMEFYDVHFSYFDLETMDEHFVSVPEQGGSSLISQDILSPGHLHFIGSGETSIIGTFKLELQVVPGNGKAMRTGMANNAKIRDSFNIAMNYFKANSQRISGSIQPGNWDFLVQLLDLQGTGTPQESSLALFISLCSAALKRTVQVQLVVLGDMTLGGTISPVSNLAGSLQVAFDAGARRILLPMSSAVDIVSVPPELFAKFQTSFYTDPVDAVFKALAIT
ncbi:protease Lon-related BREX system protein BrxL [Cylindrospermopsis raciborskii]|uniref:TIGR02688 family protein n=1 Tax=Cylindrospermopsis raciborskii CENA303 TaxID=1170769 RepID=A0A1X4G9H8_9CYAN|nr:protease Lon-related BREX system protein BrxL [Cylindrospermopsis raciborskii]MCZ2207473.1 protease Lon-related BREX system protein BrxL [Cylindrospermopsis raciborskii PAMP2011]NLQ05611.1 protease Lon-related BREX system protein BrxL [Cylindrospermopsis raciborskii MVCC19]OHY34510.1 TIGR02688 family protein [Cylindrospermopsis raciborskii MVCC14]OSO93350.1 TIGR02688 family protein [Cylindrospermopsis raciborskii CENA303]